MIGAAAVGLHCGHRPRRGGPSGKAAAPATRLFFQPARRKPVDIDIDIDLGIALGLRRRLTPAASIAFGRDVGGVIDQRTEDVLAALERVVVGRRVGVFFD